MERERFVELVQGPGEALEARLAEAALLLSAVVNGGGDVDRHLGELAGIAAGVREPTVDALVDQLFGDLGFAGNREAYYEPENSYLDVVLQRRVGIPITLAVVMIDVGRRVGVRMEGVGMPGHFLVRAEGRLLDPFDGGRTLTVAGAEARFRELHGPAAFFDERFLEPVPARAILARMLANLTSALADRLDGVRLARVLALREAIPGAAPDPALRARAKRIAARLN